MTVKSYFNLSSQGLLPKRHYQKLRLCPRGHVLSGEQHHADKLQAVPVREMPGGGHEARAGGRQSEEEAGGEAQV